jgi:hypothetical protein
MYQWQRACASKRNAGICTCSGIIKSNKPQSSSRTFNQEVNDHRRLINALSFILGFSESKGTYFFQYAPQKRNIVTPPAALSWVRFFYPDAPT